MLSVPSFRMVIEPPVVKPVMLAAAVALAPSASRPATPVAPPGSVTEMTSLVEPTMDAVLLVPEVAARIPTGFPAPVLTTVMLSLSSRLAVASLPTLSTSMAEIAGSIVVFVPRVTVAVPLPSVVARMPRVPAAMLLPLPRTTLTALVSAALVMVALMPTPVTGSGPSPLMVTLPVVSTATPPLPLVVATTPFTAAQRLPPLRCTATFPVFAPLAISAWIAVSAKSAMPSSKPMRSPAVTVTPPAEPVDSAKTA